MWSRRVTEGLWGLMNSCATPAVLVEQVYMVGEVWRIVMMLVGVCFAQRSGLFCSGERSGDNSQVLHRRGGYSVPECSETEAVLRVLEVLELCLRAEPFRS